ncbi:hypothetical protein PUN28_010272 [Cardiocondyla obscurior]|uniref:Alpha-glucosidase n=1 Tax=Cardiocondyla obscurior TaxID=286306 RepID=A0AAW2FRC1_9HYME
MQLCCRATMRFLIILLFITVAICCGDSESQKLITKTFKSGNYTFDQTNSKRSVFTLTKNDGTSTVNYFIINSPTGNIRTFLAIDADKDKETITVTHTSADPDSEIIHCFQLTDDTEWFGGPEIRHQHWPVQHMYYEEEPYIPTHPENMAITERYWLSSKGVYIYVNEESPLFLDQNNYQDKYLCLIAKNKKPYQHRDKIELKYNIGVFENPKVAHLNAVNTFLGKPTGRPNERMIRYPIWSTWARYKANITEKVVEAFADEIKANKFENSQLEIDDNWETCYGSAEFNTVKFPDIKGLVQRLKNKGFRVTLWIHPFINRGCEPAFSTALKNNYFVKNFDGQVAMSWWQGIDAATIDFTNPSAVTWWVNRLRRLQKLGIETFKFDAGEGSWLPQVPNLLGPSDSQPGLFTQDYVRVLAANFGDSVEVRVGWRSQDLPIFVRMIDKDTKWTWNNGLPTLITTLLQMNLNGYVHVLPDMIGGNGYLDGSLNGTEYPSKEIFIRWLQTNVFMPSLQYSFTPWDYDTETVEICRKFTDLHDTYTNDILKAMRNAITRGIPVNPPIWWIDPENSEAHKINDEYLLGENILVAPVIEQNAEKRNIYLPKGLWDDPNREDSDVPYEGPRWLLDYPAPLGVLPYFIKLE